MPFAGVLGLLDATVPCRWTRAVRQMQQIITHVDLICDVDRSMTPLEGLGVLSGVVVQAGHLGSLCLRVFPFPILAPVTRVLCGTRGVEEAIVR